jgi:N-glycosylase/DNA lyase
MGDVPGGAVWMVELPLVGPGGEPVDLWRVLLSHGCALLPPGYLDESTRAFEVTLPMDGGRPRIVQIAPGRPGHARLTVVGQPPSAGQTAALVRAARHILRLDEDLSPFYALIHRDPDLAWAVRGAGRMAREMTVFEDVVKTICTTNCTWAATERMVRALVAHLGTPAAGAPRTGWRGRTFPTPEAMAAARPGFYRSVVRAGYRGPYLRSLARMVADRVVDLEALGRARPEEVPDEEVERRLRALPGVGPYAAAHIMLMLGRYSRPILDAWTRLKYARLIGRRRVSDAAIVRRFRRYGRYAGLAFWLVLTRDWVEE